MQRRHDGKWRRDGVQSRYNLAEGPAGRVVVPVYNFPGISRVLFKGKISRDPFKVPPSLFAGFPPRSSRIPRKRGYPSIRRRVPIANEKSCSVAFNSMCRATRATISTRSINRVSCARISISGCLVDEHLYSRSYSLLKGTLSREFYLRFYFISARRRRNAHLLRGFAFQRSAQCAKEMFRPRRYISNLMFRLHGNNFVEAISSIYLCIS